MQRKEGSALTKASSKLTRILLEQFRLYRVNQHPNLLAWMDPVDVRRWYFLIVGLDDPYLGGEYIFTLTAPDDFPAAPPRFEFVTQNGVFTPGGAICISVGEFHAGDAPGKDGAHGWRASLGMRGFAIQVVNALICFDGRDSGIRIINSLAPVKRTYARVSRAYNMQNSKRVMEAFEEYIEMNPELEAVLNARDGRLRLAGRPVPPRAPAPSAPTTAVPAAAPTPAARAPAPTAAPAAPASAPAPAPSPSPAPAPAPAPAVPASATGRSRGEDGAPREDNLADTDMDDLIDALFDL